VEAEEAKLKVLHLVKTSVGAVWAFRQMRELVRLGVEVHVALPPDGPLVPEYQAAGIKTHLAQFDFPSKKPWRYPRTANELRQLVDHVKPDIIHSHFVGTTLTLRLALGKRHPIPRVFQVPGPLHLEHPFFRQAEIRTAGPCDYWVGSCRWTCERYIKSGIPKDRIFLSYYGTDVNQFLHPEKGKLRRELQADATKKIVGLVAFMYPPKWYLGQSRGLKGHEDLIDAIAICLKQGANLLGVFVGGAWNNAVEYENRVRAYARKRCGNGAIFLGTRNDARELYPDMDVVVHASRSDNVGGAVESLLSMVPTITTNVGGFPDVITHGKTGWLVPARDPAALANAIMDVLVDPARAQDMARKGRERVLRLFRVEETSKQVLEIYRTILGLDRNN